MNKGSISWRNNNPGNLRFGAFALRHGATHESGGFAVFPDFNTGFAALCALLRTKSYCDLNLHDAMHRYAPASENHTENYIKFIEQEIDVTAQTILRNISTERLARAIQKFEGWIIGN